jgi:hypothetical protein
MVVSSPGNDSSQAINPAPALRRAITLTIKEVTVRHDLRHRKFLLLREHALLWSEDPPNFSYPTEISDVKVGTCGTGGKYSAGYRYDYSAGIGSPKTLIGK